MSAIRSYVRASLPQDAMFIKTAFMTNIGSGYFYVEAEKEVHVRKAIQNIRFVNTRKMTLVPIKEMVQAITIQKKKVRPTVRRIRHRLAPIAAFASIVNRATLSCARHDPCPCQCSVGARRLPLSVAIGFA